MDQMLAWIPKKEAALTVDDVRPLALPTTLARIFSAVLRATARPLLSAAMHPAPALVSNA